MPAPFPALEGFHPAVAGWFAETFPAPTEAQSAAWPRIASGRHVLVAAPTGSGKTLTAFLAAIDSLVRMGLDDALPDATRIVYVSPLKALSNDIHLNLEAPLAGIREHLARLGLPDVEIRTAVRTGDTPQSERAALRRRPPHILVTTPESLYVLLGSESGRAMLAGTRTVIVDEIHAMVSGKRGSHLALSLERLEALCGRPLARIGLSATQKPVDEVARFLVGGGNLVEGPDGGGRPEPDCDIVDIGHGRPRDLALELPPAPLQAVMSGEQWATVHARLAELVRAHRTTLVFVNTRRMAERTARHLAELLGHERVAAHHGSLSRELRLDAEQRLKSGQLQVLVATASLELGIDIGDVDLACQIGSPRSIAAFLQRVGRSGHHVGGVPKGRLFPTSRDELVECTALLDCVRRGELDTLRMPPAPLDVLAQQVLAEVASREWEEDALYAVLRRAWPYASLARKDFDDVVAMLAEGFASRRGVRTGLLHRDAVNGRLRGRRAARMVAVTSGGTIPETGDYTVLLEPQSVTIGTVNEDFAIESIAGDIFQLGNASYRILKVEAGRVRVEDAQGQPPNIPFWLGEAPGRTDELSVGVSRLRDTVETRLRAAEGDTGPAVAWLVGDVGVHEDAARQVAEYLASQLAAFGMLPTRGRIAMERFFDESGGTQLLIHSPFGSRVNRAWGLALRKRFCRKFNFELQAAATEDAIVLSLSTSHSFPLAEVAGYLHSSSAEHVLVQALLDAPMFAARWRWNATNALALPRFSGGKKVAPQLQRMRSEDLLATVFPDQVACLENIVGEREVPDHPLVAQTLHDCLHEAMDVDGWLALLRGLESGGIEVVARDLTAPSPFAAEALGARPHAFLDDAPLEERRTQAVATRRPGVDTGDLGRLDPDVVRDVGDQAWPQARDADEMHEALMGLGVVTSAEAAREGHWPGLLAALAREGRATCFKSALAADPSGADALWCATERSPQVEALRPGEACEPPVRVPDAYGKPWSREDALAEMFRARLSGLVAVTAGRLSAPFGVADDEAAIALARLESEGYAMRGRYSGAAQDDGAAEEWCERHLLARIHRQTLGRLRREIAPVPPRAFMRFLCDWQRVSPGARAGGPEALAGVLAQLEGFEAAAGNWETALLPARLADYAFPWLDELCAAGRIAWARLREAPAEGKGGNALRSTPLVLAPRRDLARWARLASGDAAQAPLLSSRAQRVAGALRAHGASFFDDLLAETHLLRTELEDALGELVARGVASCDSFAGLRALMVPAARRNARARRRQHAMLGGIEDAGRWTLARGGGGASTEADVEHAARVLLRRYGVVSWRLLEREAPWMPRWRVLAAVYRRLEARGEIRGGRFVDGLAGEQFALPEAVGLLRDMRKRDPDGAVVVVAASDPLNLAGLLVGGSRVPRQPGARVAWRDGIAVGWLVGGEVAFDPSLEVAGQPAVRAALVHGGARPAASASAAVPVG